MLRVERLPGTRPEGQVDRPFPAVSTRAGRSFMLLQDLQGECYASLSSTDPKTEGALLRVKGKGKDIFF